MSPERIFLIDLILSYVAWSLFRVHYLGPKLKSMDGAAAQRFIATIHSFRYIGLAVLLPGFVGAGLPAEFARPTAYGDLLSCLLAIAVLLSGNRPKVFWLFAWCFNLVGLADLLITIFNAVRLDLPAIAGQLGVAYVFPTVYVPLLMTTHVAALQLLLKRQGQPLIEAAVKP